MRAEECGVLSIEGVEPGAVYLLRSRISCRFYGHVDLLHVISRFACGEIRGYMRPVGTAGAWTLRRPARPLHWPEIDAAVTACIGEPIETVIGKEGE